jgi:hypothetical protein
VPDWLEKAESLDRDWEIKSVALMHIYTLSRNVLFLLRFSSYVTAKLPELLQNCAFFRDDAKGMATFVQQARMI